MAILPKIVSRWFAPHRRGFGMSLITPGANFSAIILGIIAPLIIGAMGWQWTYVIFGIVFAVITVDVLPRRTRGEGSCALRRSRRHTGRSRAEA